MLSTSHDLASNIFLVILFRGISYCFKVSTIILNCRDILELTEAIKIKDGEADAYISEIEVPYFVYFGLLIDFSLFIPAHGSFPFYIPESFPPLTPIV